MGLVYPARLLVDGRPEDPGIREVVDERIVCLEGGVTVIAFCLGVSGVGQCCQRELNMASREQKGPLKFGPGTFR